jgi:hypothetical protein
MKQALPRNGLLSWIWTGSETVDPLPVRKFSKLKVGVPTSSAVAVTPLNALIAASMIPWSGWGKRSGGVRPSSPPGTVSGTCDSVSPSAAP